MEISKKEKKLKKLNKRKMSIKMKRKKILLKGKLQSQNKKNETNTIYMKRPEENMILNMRTLYLIKQQVMIQC